MPLSFSNRDGTWQLIVCFIASGERSGNRFASCVSNASLVTGFVLVPLPSTSMIVAITPVPLAFAAADLGFAAVLGFAAAFALGAAFLAVRRGACFVAIVVSCVFVVRCVDAKLRPT